MSFFDFLRCLSSLLLVCFGTACDSLKRHVSAQIRSFSTRFFFFCFEGLFCAFDGSDFLFLPFLILQDAENS